MTAIPSSAEAGGESAAAQPSSNGAGPSADSGEPMRLGGMAMRNGLLVHGPTSWAAAARNSKTGDIDVASGPKPNFGGNLVAKVPLLRGPVRMAEAFAVIPIARKALPSARLPFEDPRVLLAAGGVTLANNVLRGKGGSAATPGREAAAAVLGMLPAMVALSGTELAAYHGVEHKAIAAYEQGSRDPSIAAKEHDRCGSNLIAPMMIFTVAGQAILQRLPNRPGHVAQATVSVASLSLAVETFVYAERNPDSPVGRAVHAGGNSIQRLFATREPNDEQIEVGVAAMDAILEAEGAA
ncbi:MAG TPA: DUF1385 domain-containing protein [Solirubrobacterales bacterium]|nr:DUF1385 domain-containing protein [Solirubrobacterales bacterium]